MAVERMNCRRESFHCNVYDHVCDRDSILIIIVRHTTKSIIIMHHRSLQHQDNDDKNRFITIMHYNKYSKQFDKIFPLHLVHKLPHHVFEEFITASTNCYNRNTKWYTSPLYLFALLIYLTALITMIATIVLSALFVGPGAYKIFGRRSDPKYNGPNAIPYPTVTWAFYILFPAAVIWFFVVKLLVVDFVSRRANHRMHAVAAVAVKNTINELMARYFTTMGSSGIVWDFEYKIYPGMNEYEKDVHERGTLSWWFPACDPSYDHIEVVDIERVLSKPTSIRPLSKYYPVLKLIDITGIDATLTNYVLNKQLTIYDDRLYIKLNEVQECMERATISDEETIQFGKMPYDYIHYQFVDPTTCTQYCSVSSPQNDGYSIVHRIDKYVENLDRGHVASIFEGTLEHAADTVSLNLRPALKYRIGSYMITIVTFLTLVVGTIISGVYYRWVDWLLYTMLACTVVVTVMEMLIVPHKFYQLFLRAHENSLTELQSLITAANLKVFHHYGLEWSVTIDYCPKVLTHWNWFRFKSYPIPSQPVLSFNSIPKRFMRNRPTLVIDTGSRSDYGTSTPPQYLHFAKVTQLRSPSNEA
jgi:hypothetical protein